MTDIPKAEPIKPAQPAPKLPPASPKVEKAALNTQAIAPKVEASPKPSLGAPAKAPIAKPVIPVASPQKRKLVLPTERTTPNMAMKDYTWLIYGPPKIGKTTAANEMFGKALTLKCEEGTRHLSVYGVDIQSYEDIDQVYELLAKGGHDFEAVVIDTIDLFYRFFTLHVCQKRGIEHIGDLGHGKGYGLVNEKFIDMLHKFVKLDLCLVMLSHAKEVETTSAMEKWNRTTVSLSNSPRETVTGLVDIIAYMDFDPTDKSKRVMRLLGDKYLDAGARVNETLKFPEQCNIDRNTDYAEIKALFKGESK